MPLVHTPARLKLLQACDQWHSSRASSPLTGSHCKFRPNAEGNFIATFPKVYYFKGTLSCNCNDVSLSDTLNSNPNLRYCLEKASVVLVLKQKTSIGSSNTVENVGGYEAVSRDQMVDGPSVALAARLVKHLPHKKTRMVLELSLRDNFSYVHNKLETSLHVKQTRFSYIYNQPYQQGAVVSDTFVDILLGQAYLSGCGRDTIKVYSQLLSISDGKYISQGFSQANGFLGGVAIDSKLFRAIADYVGKSDYHISHGLITYDDACKYAIEVMYALPMGILYDYHARTPEPPLQPSSQAATVATDATSLFMHGARFSAHVCNQGCHWCARLLGLQPAYDPVACLLGAPSLSYQS
jgi:hypothetical protein